MWNYAELSKAAANSGGPEKFMNELVNQGFAAGQRNMKVKLGGLALVGGATILYGAYKGCSYAFGKFTGSQKKSEDIVDDFMNSNLTPSDASEDFNILGIEILSDDEKKSAKVIVDDMTYYLVSFYSEELEVIKYVDEDEVNLSEEGRAYISEGNQLCDFILDDLLENDVIGCSFPTDLDFEGWLFEKK